MEHEGQTPAARIEDMFGEVPLLTQEEVDAFMASIVAMVAPAVECAPPVQSAPLDERTADDLIELIAAGVDITPAASAMRTKLRLGLDARKKHAGAEPLELAPVEPAEPVAPVEPAKEDAERKARKECAKKAAEAAKAPKAPKARKAGKAPKAPETKKTAPTKAARKK